VSFSDAWYGSVGYGLATTNIGGFNIYNNNTGLYDATVNWGLAGTDFDAGRGDRIRYDSPTFAGFTASASWGFDDAWDVALRYANEFNGVRVAAAASYRWSDTFVGFTGPEGGNGNLTATGIPLLDDTELETYGASIAFFHVPSGFHIQGGFSNTELDGAPFSGIGAAAAAPFFSTVEQDHYWVATGVQFRANSLGSSDVTIQYIQNDWDSTSFIATGTGSAEYTAYGIGFTQNIDAIGASAYISYNRHEFESDGGFLNTGVGFGPNVDSEFDQVTAGMRIRY